MKNITVREAALALGLTKRAIMYRLTDGKLKGTRVKNENGQIEWRVYPTKEILDALQRAVDANPTAEPAESSIVDAIDVDDVELTEDLSSFSAGENWEERQREQMRTMAEEFVRPLLERIDSQSRVLAVQEREIDELKIKLLPDLKKRAEEERKAAELKEAEVIALQKQLDAIREEEEEKHNSIVKDLEDKALKERQSKEAELARLASDLRDKEEALKEAESTKEKVVELESKLPDLEQKLAQEAAEKAKLEEEKKALEAALAAKSQSWFKKLFSSPQP